MVLHVVAYDRLSDYVVDSMILARARPSIYISSLMFLWGAVAALLSLVQTPAQLIGVRFLLGVFEAGFTVIWLYHVWRIRDAGWLTVILASGPLSDIDLV